jgi:hypothetical protein
VMPLPPPTPSSPASSRHYQQPTSSLLPLMPAMLIDRPSSITHLALHTNPAQISIYSIPIHVTDPWKHQDV